MAQRGINLLPQEGRAELQAQHRTVLLNLVGIGLAVVVVLLLVGDIGANYYLGQRDAAVAKDLDTAKKNLNSVAQIEQRQDGLVNKLTRMGAVLGSYSSNADVMTDVSTFTPSGIKLTSLAFDASGKVAVSGASNGPASFGNFLAILRDPTQGGKKFSNVEINSFGTSGGTQGLYQFSLTMTRRVSR